MRGRNLGQRRRKLRDACVTAKGQQIGAVVCVHAKGMKEPWCLATSQREATAATLVKHYPRRWTIDIDQAWRLSRIKGWVGSTCTEAFWVEHQSRQIPGVPGMALILEVQVLYGPIGRNR